MGKKDEGFACVAKRWDILFLSSLIFSNVSFFSFCLSCSLATWTCLPNFLRSRSFLASAEAFLAVASSTSLSLTFCMWPSSLTISAK